MNRGTEPTIGPLAAFELAAGSASRTIADRAVAASWEEPSVLPRMTVGALAGHLLAVVRTFERRCDVELTATETVDPAAGYAEVRLEHDRDLDLPRFRSVRDGAVRQADRGPAAVSERFDACVARLGARLRAGAPRWIQLPDPTQRSTFETYATTRVVELVVHTDDLARSTEVQVAPIDPALATLVIGFLVASDRHRIGDTEVLRALAGRADPGDLRAL